MLTAEMKRVFHPVKTLVYVNCLAFACMLAKTNTAFSLWVLWVMIAGLFRGLVVRRMYPFRMRYVLLDSAVFLAYLYML